MNASNTVDVTGGAQQGSEDSQDNLTLNSKSQLSSTLSFIRQASNDSEKLAGILLVTKLFMSSRPDTKSVYDIYTAIGLKFIKKLVRSQERSYSDNSVRRDYVALGLSMLTCFTSEAELAMRPELLQLTTEVMALLATFQPNDEKAMVDNAFFVLCNLIKSEMGSRVFVESQAITKLLQNEYLVNERCRELIQLFTAALPKLQSWCINSKDYYKLLLVAFLRLSKVRDSDSFQIWKSISHLLSVLDRFTAENTIHFCLTNSESRELRTVVCTVLMGMMKSRVPVDVRRDAILIAYYIINCFGVGWIYTFTSTDADVMSGHQLLALIIALAAVEVKMLLESPDSAENKTRENFKSDIVAYFAIAEKVTIFLVNGGNDQPIQGGEVPSSTRSEHIIKACCGLDDLVGAVMKYMKRALSKNDAASALEDHLVIAAYRAVCAWLSEETEALREEVQEIIPDLIHLAVLDFRESKVEHDHISSEVDLKQSSGRPNLLEFLVPVLCHLSAEPTTRQILLHCKTHHLLKDSLVLILEKLQADNVFEREHVETLIGVFLNICITEPDLISEDKIFSEVMDQLLDIVPYIYNTHRLSAYQVLTNLIALGLLLLKYLGNRLQDNASKTKHFLRTCFSFLVETSPVSENIKTLPEDAKSFSDLWYISFSNLISLKKSFNSTLNFQADSSLIERMKLFSCQAKNSEVKFDHDVMELLEVFLQIDL